MPPDTFPPPPPITVRPAVDADVPAITRVYNQGIVDRVATLETEERSEDERRSWLATRRGRGEGADERRAPEPAPGPVAIGP